jgi:hypothetical protein
MPKSPLFPEITIIRPFWASDKTIDYCIYSKRPFTKPLQGALRRELGYRLPQPANIKLECKKKQAGLERLYLTVNPHADSTRTKSLAVITALQAVLNPVRPFTALGIMSSTLVEGRAWLQLLMLGNHRTEDLQQLTQTLKEQFDFSDVELSRAGGLYCIILKLRMSEKAEWTKPEGWTAQAAQCGVGLSDIYVKAPE